MKAVREAKKRARKRLVTGASERRLRPRSAVANGVAAAGGAFPRPPPPRPPGPPPALPQLEGAGVAERKPSFWWEPREKPAGEGLIAPGGHAVGGARPWSPEGPAGALRHSGGEEGKLR